MEERVNRRSSLQKAAIGGGGLLIFTAGGVAWRAWDRGSFAKIYEVTAFDPWEDWRNNRIQFPHRQINVYYSCFDEFLSRAPARAS